MSAFLRQLTAIADDFSDCCHRSVRSRSCLRCPVRSRSSCGSSLGSGPANLHAGVYRTQRNTATSVSDGQQGNYIFSHFYDVAIVSTKLSVLALYYRVFVTSAFRTVVIITAAFILMWLVTMEVVLGLECRPIQAWWGATEGSCVDLVAFGYFTNITNLASDMWIFLLPIPTILRLQTSRYRKISLCFLFSVGLGTCVISGARLSVIVSMGATDITCKHSTDKSSFHCPYGGGIHAPFSCALSLLRTDVIFFSGDEVPLGILSAWEPCGGILCANIPMIYRAFSKMVENPSSGSTATSQSLDSGNHKRPHDGSNWLPLDESRSIGGVVLSSLH